MAKTRPAFALPPATITSPLGASVRGDAALATPPGLTWKTPLVPNDVTSDPDDESFRTVATDPPGVFPATPPATMRLPSEGWTMPLAPLLPLLKADVYTPRLANEVSSE